MPSGSSRMRSTICCGVWRSQPGAVVRAVLDADAGVQQAQVVVDLGDRADGRAGVAAGRLLVDRDRRRQALDDVDVGLVHLPEELAGVRRQRLDVAALALGVDRVEGQAGLAGPGQPGEHDQLVAGQLDVDVLEVVLAGAAHRDDGRSGCGGRSGHQLVQPTEEPHRWHSRTDVEHLSDPNAIVPTSRRRDRAVPPADRRRRRPRAVRTVDSMTLPPPDAAGAVDAAAAPLPRRSRWPGAGWRWWWLVCHHRPWSVGGALLDPRERWVVVPLLFVVVVPFEKLFPRHRQRLRRAGARHRPRLRRQPSRCSPSPASSSAPSSGCSAWRGCPGWPCGRSSTPCRAPAPRDPRRVVLFDLVDLLGAPLEPRGAVPVALPRRPPLDRAPRLGQRPPRPPVRRRAARPAVRVPARRRVRARARRRRSPSSRSSPGCSSTPTCAGAGGRCTGS